MDYPLFNTARLGEITDKYYFAAQCAECKHGKRLNVARLTQTLGQDFAVIKVRQRLRCTRCGSKRVVVSFLNPSQRSNNLIHLFDEPTD